jgi:hypothetical protein
MPGREPFRTDRVDLEREDLVRLDPGVVTPADHSRVAVLRGVFAQAAWRFPAAIEEMRLLARPGSVPNGDVNRAFYRPDEDVDESGDGGPVEAHEKRLLPPH